MCEKYCIALFHGGLGSWWLQFLGREWLCVLSASPCTYIKVGLLVCSVNRNRNNAPASFAMQMLRLLGRLITGLVWRHPMFCKGFSGPEVGMFGLWLELVIPSFWSWFCNWFWICFGLFFLQKPKNGTTDVGLSRCVFTVQKEKKNMYYMHITMWRDGCSFNLAVAKTSKWNGNMTKT